MNTTIIKKLGLFAFCLFVGINLGRCDTSLNELSSEIEGVIKTSSDPFAKSQTSLNILSTNLPDSTTNYSLSIERINGNGKSAVTNEWVLNFKSGRRTSINVENAKAVTVQITAVDRKALLTGYYIQKGKTNTISKADANQLEFTFKLNDVRNAKECADLWKELLNQVGMEVRFFTFTNVVAPASVHPHPHPQGEGDAMHFVTVIPVQIIGSDGVNNFITNSSPRMIDVFYRLKNTPPSIVDNIAVRVSGYNITPVRSSNTSHPAIIYNATYVH